jgi:hypothetical protein
MLTPVTIVKMKAGRKRQALKVFWYRITAKKDEAELTIPVTV